MTITRSSQFDDDLQRFEALYELASYLDSNRPRGVVWHYGKVQKLGVLALRVCADGMAGQLAVTPVWFLGPHRNDFVPIPVRGPMSFQVTQLHWRDAMELAPYAFEHVLYGDAPDVRAAIVRWNDARDDEAAKPIPSIGAAELFSLRAIVDAAAVPPEVVPDVDPSSPPLALTAQAREALAEDLASISPELLALHMPWDDKGRLALGATALLTSYESDELLGGKSAWLAALTPDRRRDAQVVRVSLRPIASSPYAFMWDSARWLWDRRAVLTPESVRWGVAGLDVGALGIGDRAARIQNLSRRCASGTSLADRVAVCILLQDEGRLEEAFELFGITLGDDITRLIHGLPISGYLGTSLQSWTDFLRHQLRSAAPWLMPAVLDAEVDRRATLRSEPRRPPCFRLFALPHQTSVAKRSVMFVARKMDGSEPALELETTGWDYRLPEPAWKRPLEIDLRRFGLADPL
jgi:hypothetical protein